MKTTSLTILTALGLAFSAQAAIYFEFTGSGAGGDAMLRISEPITFNVTADHDDPTVSFVIQGAASVLGFGQTPAGGTISYNVNGGVDYPLSAWSDAGFDFDEFSADDTSLWGAKGESISVGDTVTLNNGTFSINSADAPFDLPTSGTYEIFLSAPMTGKRYSENGVVMIPEPGSSALLALGCTSFLLLRRRKGQRSL